MKQEETLFQDYHGMFYYIEKNKSKNLTIFLIDDDPFYLLLLKEELIKNPNFRVISFSKGEDCLFYLNLKPDLIDLRNSGDTAGSHDRVVGYGAYLFYD